jgi:hypothetical protein
LPARVVLEDPGKKLHEHSSMQTTSNRRDSAVDPRAVAVAAARPQAASAYARTLFMSVAAQDWLLIIYLGVLVLACYHGAGPYREAAIERLCVDVACLLIGIVAYRGQLLRGWFAALVYRLGVFVGLFGSFLQLDLILPTANSSVVDGSIYAFDQRMFHVEPAVAWDRFVTAGTTEWFSFFYYSYFFILAAHVLPVMFVEKRREVIGEFALGILSLYAIAHMLYMVVPAYGPWVHLNGQFSHELHGSFWWPLVRKTVDAVGARKDVFPSLHTAGPTFLALFSWRHRKKNPFRYTWPVVAFFATQIIIATMFLRWHYLVDIVAGLTLAISVTFVTPKVLAWERDRRARYGLEPTWTMLPWPKSAR